MTYSDTLKTVGIGYGLMPYASAFKSTGIGPFNYIHWRPIPALSRTLEYVLLMLTLSKTLV